MNDSLVVTCTEVIAPTRANLLVRPDPPDETVGSKGLILRPDNTKTRSQRGTVIAIGPDCKGLKVADRVIFTYWSAIHLDVNGEELFLYDEKEILGVLQGEARAQG